MTFPSFDDDRVDLGGHLVGRPAGIDVGHQAALAVVG